jgi:ribosomal protein S18 acetylase RimI-like enzyme
MPRVRDAVRVIHVRQANLDDGAALARIDAQTWTADVSPAPPPPVGTPFFGERTPVGDVFVAEIEDAVAGYVRLGQSISLPSRQHVLDICGLAVDPGRHRRGVGHRLVEEAIEQAQHRGARKLSLRVLASNAAARRLYEASGFTIESILREEFVFDGRPIDDVLMAFYLS